MLYHAAAVYFPAKPKQLLSLYVHLQEKLHKLFQRDLWPHMPSLFVYLLTLPKQLDVKCLKHMNGRKQRLVAPTIATR